MKPYLEVKVVKTKEKTKGDDWGYISDEGLEKLREAVNIVIKSRIFRRIKKPEPKGNWVNGENLDKIKFPCFCSYVDEDKKKYIGIINCYVDKYSLYSIEKQSKDNFIDDCTSLENLINSYDIHILKGKIILFEEE